MSVRCRCKITYFFTLADVPEDAEPVAIDTAGAEPAGEAPETRRRTLEESGDRAASTAAEIDAASFQHSQSAIEKTVAILA